MDRILNYLPEIVHVVFGWNNGPDHWGGMDNIERRTILIPKEWLKHGERGRYDEWTIKKTYQKKLVKEFGEEFLHSSERIEVMEWNQLENVAGLLHKAKRIDFDNIFEIAKTVNEMDIKYTHNINI